MDISYNWLQSFFEQKLPEAEKLADVFTMRSLEVESVEESDGDFTFDIAMLPSRKYDYVDHHGVVRDIAAALKMDIKKGMVEATDEKDCKMIILKVKDMEKILGIEIGEGEIVEILSRLGFVVKKTGEALEVLVPNFRPDIELKEDLVEEVARIYGYESIEAKMPEGALIPSVRNDNFFYSGMAKNILKGLGYSEVYNYSFTPHGDFELENPIARGKEFMRTHLMHGLENNVAENGKNFKDIKIFELGKVFPASGEHLALGVINNKADFYEMKGVAEAILTGMGINDFYFEDSKEKLAEVHADSKSVGHIDHNTIELNFSELVNLANESMEFSPISKYPVATRDIAIFVPTDTKVAQVMDVIENTAGELLIDTDLFDIFEKEDRISLAFRLMFQAQDRTLTDEEINAIRDKIFEAIEATDPSWEIRR